MYLSEVEVHNFRSLEHLVVKLQPGLNVLVGRNNTGKTNLIQAIRNAIGPLGSTGEPVWLSRDDFFRESPDDDTERTTSVTLTYSDLSEGERAHFFEIADFNLADPSKSRAIIRFEASWPKGKRQPTIKRSGGPPQAEPTEVPSGILESLPVTYLPALRDAAAGLAPGRRSRLAQLLEELDYHKGGGTKTSIERIFSEANKLLESDSMVDEVRNSLQTTTFNMAGSDYEASAIRATEAKFEGILRSLQVQMPGQPIGSLEANGLGYNNILFIAVTLEYLKIPSSNETRLLLVEEPESHLHPQLTTLLANFLANKTPGIDVPQTIVTTHSPTLAANVSPGQVSLLYLDPITHKPVCHAIAEAGLDEHEEMQLQRMMDVTRASLYFAKGAILVEGISEVLLIPELAKRLGHNLCELHISVIPICGVAFGTFYKLLSPAVFGIPVSVITDGDPTTIRRGENWEQDEPTCTDGAHEVSERTSGLLEEFKNTASVCVRHSKVTLEYDLAEAGLENASLMARAWDSLFVGIPRTFGTRKLEAAGQDKVQRALCAWRGICRADSAGSKAEFAHKLAGLLGECTKEGKPKERFTVPTYITEAISFVVGKVSKPATQIVLSASSPGQDLPAEDHDVSLSD